MPKKLEEKLKRRAKKKGMSEAQTSAYVYGTLRSTGWAPTKKKKKQKKKR